MIPSDTRMFSVPSAACFRWCYIRQLDPQAKDSQIIKLADKLIAKELNYDGIEFAVTDKQYSKIEKKNSIKINVLDVKLNISIRYIFLKSIELDADDTR